MSDLLRRQKRLRIFCQLVKKGESIIMKLGMFYTIRDGRIARITLYEGKIR